MTKKIVFMGSPAEVCCILESLAKPSPDYSLVAVVSQPAKPVGRKKILQDPPVAQFAKALNLKCLQPTKASDSFFLDQLRDLMPDIIITAAYGQILSKEFLSIPRRATLNIHPSLLPLYRGATPVQSALIDGRQQTGTTILFTTFRLDAGNIILQETLDVLADETGPELLERLFKLSSDKLFEALAKLNDLDFTGQPQDDSLVTHCRKLNKKSGVIDWTNSGEAIYNLYRGLYGWPGVRTRYNGEDVILSNIEGVGNESSLQTGQFVLSSNKKYIQVGCGNSTVYVKSLKPAGSKQIEAVDFWNSRVNKTGIKNFV